MARLPAQDSLQSFRFRVREIDGTNFMKNTEAGFKQATLPEVSMETAEHRVGNKKYAEKYPGVVSVGDISLMKGIASADSDFWDWAKAYLNRSAYRADLLIMVYGQIEDGTTDLDTPLRVLKCYNCFPIRVKVLGDLDSSSSDVLIQELDLSVEYIELEVSELN